MPPIVVMAGIFWFSSQSSLPGPGIIWWDFLIKKTAHIIEYGLLFFSWQRALNWSRPRSKRRYAATFGIVIAYALTDEIHQSFTPGRHPMIRDVWFDFLGAFLVYLKLTAAV